MNLCYAIANHVQRRRAKSRGRQQAGRVANDRVYWTWQLKVQEFSTRRHPWLAALNFLTRVPLVREVYHSAIFGRLMRAEHDGLPVDRKAGRSRRVSA